MHRFGTRRGLLQWSRRANATECCMRDASTRTVPRFNGAVARTRRSAECDAWGDARCAASMEPSRERDGVAPPESAVALLSRGFNGAVARTRRSAPTLATRVRPHHGFNGAVARTRRSGRQRRDHRKRPRASMEPSRERDGVTRSAITRPTARRCFNGAVARTRRSAARGCVRD